MYSWCECTLVVGLRWVFLPHFVLSSAELAHGTKGSSPHVLMWELMDAHAQKNTNISNKSALRASTRETTNMAPVTHITELIDLLEAGLQEGLERHSERQKNL